MSNPSPSLNQSSLARFAFNIYGSLNDRAAPRVPERPKHSPSKKLKYVCDREITCVTQLDHALGKLGSAFHDPVSGAPAHHVVIGGKNYLKLLALDAAQTAIVADINLIDTHSSQSSRLHASSRLFNVNTVKARNDMVACGLTSGSVQIYQVANNGRARLLHKLDDHKRVVNSVDFVEQENVVFSGSQDGSVRLWDLRAYSQKPVAKLMASQHADPVRSCQYSPHSRVRGKMAVLSVHDSGALCKFDLRYPSSASTNLVLPERKWAFHTGPALSLHIHPELEYVLTGGRDRKICLWDYGETGSAAVAPHTTLNTYGPVMKIRWNETPNDGHYVSGPLDTHDEFCSDRQALLNYDFACSYLNDDPSITVFNLARKYIPREVVSTLTKKPFQNFVWARSGPGDRKLWTITKSNVFVTYDLNSAEETAQNISRPLDTLPSVATSWINGLSSLSVVSQDPADFDLSAPLPADSAPYFHDRAVSEEPRTDEERYFDPQVSAAASFESSILPNRGLQSPHPTTPTYFYQKNTTTSPKERPMLTRQSTQHSQQAMSSLGFQRSSFGDMAMTPASLRPSLNRNPSQTTVDSASSGGTVSQPGMSHGSHHGSFSKHSYPHQSLPSPYLVSMSLPLPSVDDTVFATLAHDYLTTIPDAFDLPFVCQVNARAAASVQRFRDCQTWRMMAVALEQDDIDTVSYPRVLSSKAPVEVNIDPGIAPENLLSKSPEEEKSISSDLGNVVGSYNSDSTSTTNYGSAPRKRSSTSSMNDLSILGSSRDSARGEHLSRLSHSGRASPRQSFNGFAKQAFTPADHELVPGSGSKTQDESDNTQHVKANEGREIEAVDNENEKHFSGLQSSSSKIEASEASRGINAAAHFNTSQLHAKSTPITCKNPFSRGTLASHDLDDENLHVLTNASASCSSSAFSAGTDPAHSLKLQGLSVGSRDSHGGSWQSFGGRSFPKMQRPVLPPSDQKLQLDRVEESSIPSREAQPSQLTRAMTKHTLDGTFIKPWHAVKIIQKSLEYALAQGDLVMSATLILLFYDIFENNCAGDLLEKSACLEVLGIYIETLRSKELYTIAVQVVKDSPKALKDKLSAYAVKDVEMRFYCCWCKTLLSNEMSKDKYGVDSENFGFWYCDECSRKQSNCIYCNEPCKGLTVVESLRCGHRGHFGCFQEWHMEDGNTECPGGCD